MTDMVCAATGAEGLAERHRPSRHRGARAALVAVVAATMTASCAGVPTDGAVKRGPLVGPTEQSGVIRVIARPPSRDMSPIEIVRGFLAANADLVDVDIARQYLSPSMARRWQPGEGISIVRGVPDVVAVREDSVVVSGALEGVVDSRGRWSAGRQGQGLEVPITLGRVDGQWRIASVPDGLVLTRTAADRVLRSYDLQYLDPEGRVLVPDPVVVPAAGRGLATTLVRRLLEGPSDWLGPSVITAFPEGTRLAFESVPVVGGIAQVELTAEVLATDAETRRALSAQIVRTLAPVSGVSAVRITVAGTPLPVTGMGATQPITAWSEFVADRPIGTPIALGVVEGRAVTFAPQPDAEASATWDIADLLVEVDAAPRVSVVAGISADRTRLWRGTLGDGGQVVHRGSGLASPQVHRSRVWAVERGVGVLLVSASEVVRVPVTDEQGRPLDAQVVSLRLAPDGMRAALVVRVDGRPRLLLARVEDMAQAPRLAGARRIEATLGDVIDVAWLGSSRLVALNVGGGVVRLQTAPVGLVPSEVIDVPEGAVSVAAGGGRLLLIGASDIDGPRVLVRQAGRWFPVLAGSAPAYP